MRVVVAAVVLVAVFLVNVDTQLCVFPMCQFIAIAIHVASYMCMTVLSVYHISYTWHNVMFTLSVYSWFRT